MIGLRDAEAGVSSQVEVPLPEKPVLITDAAPSHDDDQAHRRRVYTTLMVVHLVGFGLSYPLYLWQWWAGVVAVLLTGLLPWVAVLLANDTTRRAGRRRPPPPAP